MYGGSSRKPQQQPQRPPSSNKGTGSYQPTLLANQGTTAKQSQQGRRPPQDYPDKNNSSQMQSVLTQQMAKYGPSPMSQSVGQQQSGTLSTKTSMAMSTQSRAQPTSSYPTYYQLPEKPLPPPPALTYSHTTPSQSSNTLLQPPDLRSRFEQKEDYKEATYPMKQSQPTQQPRSITKGIVGLRNIGNTCFMNSVLQCIMNTPEFNDAFIDNSYTNDLHPRNKGIAKEYSSLIQRALETPNFGAETPSGLKRAIEKQSSQFSGYDQQDAQEFLINLLEGINQDLNRVRNKAIYREMNDDLTNKRIQQLSQEWWEYMRSRESSIVQDYFMGQLLNQVICQQCGKEALAFDTFIDVQLSLNRAQKILDDMGLERLIEMFLKEEQLDDAFCAKCKKLQKSKRKFLIWRLPKILVFTIKRFNFRRFSSDKLQTKIQFPIENLDLRQMTKESDDPSTRDAVYHLYGIVNHSGTLYGGHYTADCRNPVDKKWYRFNDSNVHEININNQGYNSSGSSSPYILFYCKSGSKN